MMNPPRRTRPGLRSFPRPKARFRSIAASPAAAQERVTRRAGAKRRRREAPCHAPERRLLPLTLRETATHLPQRRAGISQRYCQILREFSRADYSLRRRNRAARRKSVWNLVLLVPVIPAVTFVYYGTLQFVWAVHRSTVPSDSRVLEAELRQDWGGPAAILFMLPPFFRTIPLGIPAANFLMWCAPPAARAIERDAVRHWH